MRVTLPILSTLTIALMAIAVTMIFFVAPEEADQGISQKIFYFHVPIALTAYALFGLGAWKALRVLWTRGERYDLESYTAIHQGTIFGALTLITGAIWAKFTWNAFWSMDVKQNMAAIATLIYLAFDKLLTLSLPSGPLERLL